MSLRGRIFNVLKDFCSKEKRSVDSRYQCFRYCPYCGYGCYEKSSTKKIQRDTEKSGEIDCEQLIEGNCILNISKGLERD